MLDRKEVKICYLGFSTFLNTLLLGKKKNKFVKELNFQISLFSKLYCVFNYITYVRAVFILTKMANSYILVDFCQLSNPVSLNKQIYFWREILWPRQHYFTHMHWFITLKGLAIVFAGQENLLIIFRSKEIYTYISNNKIPQNLLKLWRKTAEGNLAVYLFPEILSLLSVVRLKESKYDFWELK